MSELWKNWFTVDMIDDDTYIISEYRHWEETHCYLLIGQHRGLLIDTGLGICDISQPVKCLAPGHVTAAATHNHWDHIGGHKYFPDFYCHEAERSWLCGQFPLPLRAVQAMVSQQCDLPAGYDVSRYELFQGLPSGLLADGSTIDLGGRAVTALHTPGHSPGHLCFWEAARGYLFCGDLAYKGTLFAHYPSTDPTAYLASMKKAASLPVNRLFPGHHSLDIGPEILSRMASGLEELDKKGLLHHGQGTFDFGDWAIQV